MQGVNVFAQLFQHHGDADLERTRTALENVARICSCLPTVLFLCMMIFLMNVFELLIHILMRTKIVFHHARGHTLPGEVQHGTWRSNKAPVMKYSEYLSSDEISKHVDPLHGQLVYWRIPCENLKRRQRAWEFMGQSAPEPYLRRICGLLEEEGRRVETPSGSASAEGVGLETEEKRAEVSSSSAPAEVVDVEA